MSKQTPITKSARGQECQVRIPGICNFNSETTVLAHINGAGMGHKHPDIQAAYCCSSCHDAIDGRIKTKYTVEDMYMFHCTGVFRTQRILIEKGLITVKGTK